MRFCGRAGVGSLQCECACAGVNWRSVYVEYGYTTASLPGLP